MKALTGGVGLRWAQGLLVFVSRLYRPAVLFYNPISFSPPLSQPYMATHSRFLLASFGAAQCDTMWTHPDVYIEMCELAERRVFWAKGRGNQKKKKKSSWKHNPNWCPAGMASQCCASLRCLCVCIEELEEQRFWEWKPGFWAFNVWFSMHFQMDVGLSLRMDFAWKTQRMESDKSFMLYILTAVKSVKYAID